MFSSSIYGPVSLANSALYNLSSEKNKTVGNGLEALNALYNSSKVIEASSFTDNLNIAIN